MSRVYFSPSAKRDLNAIFDHIVKDNPAAAASFVRKLKDQCRRMAQFPEMGKLREDLALHLRCFPVGNYLIFYRPSEGAIDIVRILHAARDYARMFD
jgi:toxin ParE1/3/4